MLVAIAALQVGAALRLFLSDAHLCGVFIPFQVILMSTPTRLLLFCACAVDIPNTLSGAPHIRSRFFDIFSLLIDD